MFLIPERVRCTVVNAVLILFETCVSSKTSSDLNSTKWSQVGGLSQGYNSSRNGLIIHFSYLPLEVISHSNTRDHGGWRNLGSAFQKSNFLQALPPLLTCALTSAVHVRIIKKGEHASLKRNTGSPKTVCANLSAQTQNRSEFSTSNRIANHLAQLGRTVMKCSVFWWVCCPAAL